MIEYIEEFSAELKRHSFIDFRHFVQPEIPVVEPRSMEETAITIPDTAQRLRAECIAVEVLIWFSVGTRSGIRNNEISNEIWFIHAGSASQ